MNELINFQKKADGIADFVKSSSYFSETQKDEIEKKVAQFADDLHTMEYIKVPFVGFFNAGKSSLLNIFTQKPEMLPINIVPETAVAYEIYYGETECACLYRNDVKIDTKPLADIRQLDTMPGDIVKVFCKSNTVKEYQEKGIILVDMPGLGSGIERHDAAIFNYIKSGTAFVLVVDIEQGMLRKSTLAFTEELSRYGMMPAVMVSKIDQKPEQEIKNVVEYITYQIKRYNNNQEPYVSTVCAVNNNIKGLTDYLHTLNAEELIARRINKKLEYIAASAIECLDVKIQLRKQDIEDVEGKLKKLEEEIANVRAELPADGIKVDTPEESTQDILDNVKTALSAKAEDIAQMIIDKSETEEIKAVITSVVRAEIIASLKEESEQYSTAIGSVVQESVKKIAEIEVTADFMDGFNDIYNLVYSYIDGLLDNGHVWGKIAKVILPFLPNLINYLFGKSDEEILGEVKNKIISIGATQLAEGLRPTLLNMTLENQKRIKEKIHEEIVAKMEKVKDGLREKISDAGKSKEVVENELAALNGAVEELKAMVADE